MSLNMFRQFKKRTNPINNRKMIRALVLAGLIITVGAIANAQSASQPKAPSKAPSKGGWVGRIQISASSNTQSADASSAQHEEGSVSIEDRGQANQSTVSTTATKPTIVGSWFCTVSAPDNAPPFDSFKALWSMTGDGILVSSAQGDVTPTPFPTTSTAYGAWTQTGRRQFAASFIAILYDSQTGENMGSIRLNQSMTLSDTGLEWSGPFQAKVLDPDGNLIAMLNGSISATRIAVQALQ